MTITNNDLQSLILKYSRIIFKYAIHFEHITGFLSYILLLLMNKCIFLTHFWAQLHEHLDYLCNSSIHKPSFDISWEHPESCMNYCDWGKVTNTISAYSVISLMKESDPGSQYLSAYGWCADAVSLELYNLTSVMKLHCMRTRHTCEWAQKRVKIFVIF